MFFPFSEDLMISHNLLKKHLILWLSLGLLQSVTFLLSDKNFESTNLSMLNSPLPSSWSYSCEITPTFSAFTLDDMEEVVREKKLLLQTGGWSVESILVWLTNGVSKGIWLWFPIWSFCTCGNFKFIYTEYTSIRKNYSFCVGWGTDFFIFIKNPNTCNRYIKKSLGKSIYLFGTLLLSK